MISLPSKTSTPVAITRPRRSRYSVLMGAPAWWPIGQSVDAPSALRNNPLERLQSIGSWEPKKNGVGLANLDAACGCGGPTYGVAARRPAAGSRDSTLH